MSAIRTLFALGLGTAALLALAPHQARAETYQTCAGFIDALPATINTQGVWCLRKDLSTSVASGAAITIAANNVTIDCNDFKIGGLAAGDGTHAVGIATYKQNATIRNCAIRGFYHGIELTSGAGHAVLDSRFDSNTSMGIYVFGAENVLVRGNRISDTGGSTGSGFWDKIAVGMWIEGTHSATVEDNIVGGVVATEGGNGYAYGIIATVATGSIRGNTVSSLAADGTGQSVGIRNGYTTSRVVAQDNVVVGALSPIAGTGLSCAGAGDGMMVRANVVRGFTTPNEACNDIGGNILAP